MIKGEERYTKLFGYVIFAAWSDLNDLRSQSALSTDDLKKNIHGSEIRN
jgi:hypothetical protein